MALTTHAQRVAHLLRRTGFTATQAEVDKVKQKTIPQIVDDLLNRQVVQPAPPGPIGKSDRLLPLNLWWLGVMSKTDNPLLEKMTLFWHGHFTTSIRKTSWPEQAVAQIHLLRKHALGDFRQLVADISIENSMLMWLDNHTNIKQAPNENYARELLELFTLGIGQYTEQDVKETARALTGWKVNRNSTMGTLNKSLVDTGQKTILGKTAAFDLTSTVTHIVSHRACALFITRKLWLAFAGPKPPEATIQRLADVFRASQYSIKALMKALLTAEEFYAEANHRALIVSPAEYVVRIARLFPQLVLKKPEQTVYAMRSMGQMLFDPPNVSGWPGGAAWLSASLLFARYNYVNWLLMVLEADDLPRIKSGRPPASLLDDCLAWAGLSDVTAQTRAALLDYLGQTSTLAHDQRLLGVLHLLLVSPEFQTQ